MKRLTTALFAIATVTTTLSAPEAAHAAKSDAEAIICWGVEGQQDVDIECDFVQDIQAECKTYDPNSKSDLCKKVNSAQLVPPAGLFKLRNPSYANVSSQQEYFSEGEDQGGGGRDRTH